MSKKCPSASCGVNIEKISGCDHITCKCLPWLFISGAGMRCANFRFDLGGVCKHEFCWLCAAPYAGAPGIRTVGNHAHQSTCPYYRAHQPTTPHLFAQLNGRILEDARAHAHAHAQRQRRAEYQAAEDARAHALVPAQHQAVAPRSLGQLHEPLRSHASNKLRICSCSVKGDSDLDHPLRNCRFGLRMT